MDTPTLCQPLCESFFAIKILLLSDMGSSDAHVQSILKSILQNYMSIWRKKKQLFLSVKKRLSFFFTLDRRCIRRDTVHAYKTVNTPQHTDL